MLTRMSHVALLTILAATAGCGLLGESDKEKVSELVRSAAGGAQVSVWDVKVCRDRKSGTPLNASGYVSGGRNGRIWFLKYDGNEPSGDVDIEHDDPTDLVTRAYYSSLRSGHDRRTDCRSIEADALDDMQGYDMLRNGKDVREVFEWKALGKRMRGYDHDSVME